MVFKKLGSVGKTRNLSDIPQLNADKKLVPLLTH